MHWRRVGGKGMAKTPVRPWLTFNVGFRPEVRALTSRRFLANTAQRAPCVRERLLCVFICVCVCVCVGGGVIPRDISSMCPLTPCDSLRSTDTAAYMEEQQVER